MDKRVQNRLKRDELDKIMQKYPSLNKFLEEVTDEDKKNPELAKILEPVIHDMLEGARMQGIHIGFSAGLISAFQVAKKAESLEEAIKALHDKANVEYLKTGAKGDVDDLIEEEVK